MSNTLDDFYASFAARQNATTEALLPAGLQHEVGHFNVFRVGGLMLGHRSRPPMTFDRRLFYKISLIRGRSRIEYADQGVEVAGNALWFATPKVPYRWQPHDEQQTGYFCIFNEQFLQPAKGGVVMDDLPVFQPGTCPVWELSDAEYERLEAIFVKMEQDIGSSYAYKYELLRAYLWELIHKGQQLQPVPAELPAHSAAARTAARFTELLERQFPLSTPQQQLGLRTAKDFAEALAVHVNHLNRVLKETTGHTTTALITTRLAQEAKLLLRHTNWTVSEVADSLGFADVAHFCHFFKRQTGLVPGTFRGQE